MQEHVKRLLSLSICLAGAYLGIEICTEPVAIWGVGAGTVFLALLLTDCS